MNILSLLGEKGLINKGDVPAIEKQAASSGKTVEEILIESGFPAEDILAAKGEYFNMPTRSIGDAKIPFEILKYIPEESAGHYKLAPLGIEDGALLVGIVDPDNIEARDALNFISAKAQMPFKVFLISESDFIKVLEAYKGLSGEVNRSLTELETDLEEQKEEMSTAIDAVPVSSGKETSFTEDAPVTKIVATILRYATEGGASDIHIEPGHDKTRIRFRVDGALGTSLVLPITVHRSLVARIKVLSNMKLDERRKPQDGRFSAKIEGGNVDFRISTFPTYYGEKVVMRILETNKGAMPMEKLGLSARHLAVIRAAIKRPYGMILLSGPTGSGKTTTLYSMLSELDRDHRNVLSLEDPIEYTIDGVSQSQVHAEIGYTFATGLRTTLRQDPDIIMVGEIRDKETASLAVQAALTGHLVLSTIHTNNALGVVPRLLDMGIDPYLIPPTLILAIAQRLVRTLCPGTGKAMPVEGSMKAMLEKQFDDLPAQYRKELPPLQKLYAAAPSGECPTGMRGRIAAFEVLEMEADIERLILSGEVSEEVLQKKARENGFLTMKEDAIVKSAQGIIPFEEANTLGGDFLMMDAEAS